MFFKKVVFLLGVLGVFCQPAIGQQVDSVARSQQNEPDTVSSKASTDPSKSWTRDTTLVVGSRPSITPQKTALYSAVIPGLGQIYNRQYWKIPVIYAAAGVAVYFLYDNSVNYNKYRRMYSRYLSNDPATLAEMEQANLSADYVKYLQDYHRKYLDITVLVTALGYTVQVLDAAIFAHLKGFDISEDISMRMQPVSYPGNGLGFGLVMRF